MTTSAPHQQAFACDKPYRVVYANEVERIGEGAYVTLWRREDGREFLRIERRGCYWYRLEAMNNGEL